MFGDEKTAQEIKNTADPNKLTKLCASIEGVIGDKWWNQSLDIARQANMWKV